MLTNKEILEAIRQINLSLTNTIADAEKNESSAFYKESLKLSALHIFEKAQLLSDQSKSVAKTAFNEIVITKKEPLIETVQEREKISLKPEVLAVPAEIKPVIEILSDKLPVIENPAPQIELQKVIVPENRGIKNASSDEDKSLNAKIAKYQPPIVNIADKMKDTPIKELVKAISISKKFEFINELFNGKAEAYKSCLQVVESSNSYEEAAKYIEDNMAELYHWKEKENLATEFFGLVRRRFI